MIKTKKQMFALIGAFILTIILGTVSYAFFNYTRTGSSNTIKTGRISFNHTQGNSINLTNMFPIEANATNLADSTKVGSVTINVTGDTTYGEGIEYLVTAVNVTNTVGSGQSAKELPISINVSVEDNDNNDPATSLGTEDEEYFDNRGSSAQSSIYRVLASDAISNNDQLLVGYIKPGATGVDGNIVIKAYIDKDKVVISDTYPAEVTDTNSDGYLDGTPTSFGEGKTVFTTTEWNSLQTDGVSFQVKVEANEGIWVEEIRTINAMIAFPSTITNEKTNIKEVYFNKMGATRMQQLYDAATIKIDLTANNEGKVLAWLEENEDDSTKYNLIIASDGDTYFPEESGGLFAGFSNVSQFNFNNINTSRVTSMVAIFNGCSNLNSLDLSSFDTRNVTNMGGAFINVGVSKLDLSVLDTRNVTNMDGIVMNCNNLTELNASGLGSDVLSDLEMGFSCPNLKKIDMSNFNFGLLTDYPIYLGLSSVIEEISFENVKVSNFTSFAGMFYGASTLKTVNLSGIDLSNITNTTSMFDGDTSLEKIYVSDSWNMSNVTNSSNMFKGCTSLVGQSSNTTYSFDSNDALDKTYAVIATDNTKGYLTDISLKPTN